MNDKLKDADNSKVIVSGMFRCFLDLGQNGAEHAWLHHWFVVHLIAPGYVLDLANDSMDTWIEHDVAGPRALTERRIERHTALAAHTQFKDVAAGKRVEAFLVTHVHDGTERPALFSQHAPGLPLFTNWGDVVIAWADLEKGGVFRTDTPIWAAGDARA